jgi:hypothetical protein
MGNLIGIASTTGYQSGKDTAGIMLQYMMSKVPQTSLEEVLKEPAYHQWWLEEQSGWEIKKYAGKLKTICSVLVGVPLSKWEDKDFKENIIPGWNLTGREMLQQVGTELFRDRLDSGVWIRSLFSGFTPYFKLTSAEGMEETQPKWIITDVRFKNEADAIRERGGIVLNIVRGSNSDTHATENSLDGYSFDFTIDNNGTIDELKTKLNAVLDSVLVS